MLQDVVAHSVLRGVHPAVSVHPPFDEDVKTVQGALEPIERSSAKVSSETVKIEDLQNHLCVLDLHRNHDF